MSLQCVLHKPVSATPSSYRRCSCEAADAASVYSIGGVHILLLPPPPLLFFFFLLLLLFSGAIFLPSMDFSVYRILVPPDCSVIIYAPASAAAATAEGEWNHLLTPVAEAPGGDGHHGLSSDRASFFLSQTIKHL